jgi:hypothetical protein
MANTVPQVKDVNVSTGEEVIRAATPEEIEAMEIARIASEQIKAEAAAKEAAKAAALAKLGLTAEELAALL